MLKNNSDYICPPHPPSPPRLLIYSVHTTDACIGWLWSVPAMLHSPSPVETSDQSAGAVRCWMSCREREREMWMSNVSVSGGTVEGRGAGSGHVQPAISCRRSIGPSESSESFAWVLPLFICRIVPFVRTDRQNTQTHRQHRETRIYIYIQHTGRHTHVHVHVHTHTTSVRTRTHTSLSSPPPPSLSLPLPPSPSLSLSLSESLSVSTPLTRMRTAINRRLIQSVQSLRRKTNKAGSVTTTMAIPVLHTYSTSHKRVNNAVHQLCVF